MITQERFRVIRNFLFIGVFLFLSFTSNAAVAPVISVGVVCNAVPGQQITVPIKVTGFSGIGSFYLNLEYDYANLQYVSGIQNSSLTGDYSMNDRVRPNGVHQIIMSWSGGINGVSLPDGSTIVNVVFNYTSGPATLRWYITEPYCRSTDKNAVRLDDQPKSSFYLNGTIDGSCLTNTKPTITPGGSISFCEGGSVNLTASAGTAWKWSTNETTQSINVTTSGSYTVEVTDAGGVKSTSDATVVTVAPLPLAPTANITQPTSSVPTGTITVSSDKTGLTFSIDGSTYTNTNGIFSGLSSGDYRLTSKNVAGCISPQSILLTINAAPTAGADGPITTAPALTACVGTNINVPVTVTGFNNIGAVSLTLNYDPLVLSFNSGINTGGFPGLLIGNPVSGTIVIGGNTNNPTGYSLVNGSAVFTLNFTYLGGYTALSWFDDGESCEYAGTLSKNVLKDTPQASFYIDGSVGPASITNPTITADGSTNFCAGGNVTLNSSLGANYLWSTGATTESINVTTTGNYTVTVTDAGGCQATSDVTVVTVSPLPAAPTASVTEQTSCTSPSGTIVISSPIEDGMTYSINGSDYFPSLTFIGVVPGDYYITAKNANGCTSQPSEKITINVQPTSPTVIINNPPAVCSPETVDLTVSSITTGSSPDLTFTYWEDISATTAIQTPESVGSGIYYIKGTALSGCYDIKPVIVSVNGHPMINISDPQEVCSPSTVDITSPNITWGSSSGLTYTYYKDAGATKPVTTPSQINESGTYYIKGTLETGCFDIKPVHVEVNSIVPVSVSISPDKNNVCTGTSVTFTATPVGGGTTPHYLWYKGTTPIGDDRATYTYIPSDGDVISVKMWSSESCASNNPATSLPITMEVNLIPAAPTAEVIQPTCTVASGTITVTSDKTGLTFSIDGTTFTNTTGIFTGLVAGEYFVTAKNAAGCISEQSAKLTISAQPLAPATPTAEVTQPTCTVANGTIAVTSEKTGLSFSIDGTTFTNTTGIFSGLVAGDYFVTAKNAAGCVSEQSAKYTINAQPLAPAAPTAEVTQPTCTVATGTITVTSDKTGLTFSIDGTTFTNTTGIFSGLVAGDYFVTAKNTAGCISEQSAKLTISAQPLAPAAPTAEVTQPTCTVATGTIAVTSEKTGLTFSIDGTTFTNTIGIFSGLVAGDYFVTAKNADGCISEQSAKLTISAQPLAPAAPTAEVTQPTCTVATGTITVTSDKTGLTFSIDGTTFTNTTGIFSGLVAGDYFVTAKNADGCVSEQSAKLTISAQPLAPATPTAEATQPTCTVAAGTIAVTSEKTGLTFSIDGTTFTNTTGIFTGLVAGDYFVTAKNAAGCVSEQSAKLTISAQPLAPAAPIAEVTPELVIGSGQVVFSAKSSSGTIKWFDAATDGTEIFVLNPTINTTTTYYAEAISENGCVSSSRTAVTATVIPQGSTQLSYRFANPRIINGSGFDSFEFDVQVKANSAGTTYRNGNVNLRFEPATLSSNVANWTATAVSDHTTVLQISGSIVNIELNQGASGLAITTGYQTLVTVSAKITDENGVAGIDFNEANMNGKQFYKLSESPWYAAYTYTNGYDDADFVDTWVERVYSTVPLWTQVGGLDWTKSVNTSVWDGNAYTPGDALANTSNLRIHIPATLAVPFNGKMTVTGNTEIKKIKGLIFESDANGTGSFITNTASGAGSAVSNRYMTTNAWHIVASPVSGQIISQFLNANANVATDVDNVSIRGMMDYNPTGNNWNAYFTNSTSELIEPGKGYCIRTNANSAVSFSGTINSGVKQINSLIPAKWNSIGNPYSSAIAINTLSASSSDDFLNVNTPNLDPSYGAIYFWDNTDENNGVWGKYTIISNTPDFGSDAAFDVQQGQAFLVKMSTSATEINFNPDMQFHGPGLPLKSTKAIWPAIKLTATSNSMKSSTLIAFNANMKKGLDPTFDAGLLKGGANLSVYSRLVEDNGVAFAIQALPDNEFSSIIIPVGLDFETGGEVVFSSESIGLPSDCMVILEDKQSKTFTDLSKKDYTTTIACKSSNSDRFQLHTSYLTTGMNEELGNQKLSAYAIRNVEMIVNGNVSSEAIALVYDVLGKLIVTKKLEQGNRNAISLPSIRTGIYMLSVRDNGRVQGFKIPVRE